MLRARRRLPSGLALVAAVAAGVLGSLVPVEAAAGDLDVGFGDGGKVAVAPPAGAGEVAFATTLLPDGKLVVLGMAAPARSGYAFLAMRFTDDGRLDPTFGTGGRVWTDLVTVTSPLGGAVLGDLALGNSAAYAVAVQPDGRLVAAGTTASGATAAFAMLRYLPDGGLDPAFGDGGTVITADGLYSATSVLLDADGRAVVAGQGGIPGGFDFAVARYLPDGRLDPSFGFGGSVRTDLGASGEWASSVVREPDGALLVAGNSGSTFALIRHLDDGHLDLRFGERGVVKAGPEIGSARALIRHSDGRLVMAGGRYVPETQRPRHSARSPSPATGRTASSTPGSGPGEWWGPTSCPTAMTRDGRPPPSPTGSSS